MSCNVNLVIVSHGSYMGHGLRVTDQLTDGSRGSWVIKCDPLSAYQIIVPLKISHSQVSTTQPNPRTSPQPTSVAHVWFCPGMRAHQDCCCEPRRRSEFVRRLVFLVRSYRNYRTRVFFSCPCLHRQGCTTRVAELEGPTTRITPRITQ